MSLDKLSFTFNRIETLVSNPCDAPWWVYVKTALPALWDSFYLLLIPSPNEVLEEYLDPSQTRGRAKRGFYNFWRNTGPGGTGGGGGRKRRGGFPDPDGLVASWLPGRQLFKGRKINNFEHLFWTGLNMSDRVLFHYMLFGMSQDFIIQWSSQILEDSCDPPPQPSAGYWYREQFETNDPGVAPVRTPWWTQVYHYGSDLPQGNVQFYSPMRCTWYWHSAWFNKTSNERTFDTNLQVGRAAGHPGVSYPESATVKPQAYHDFWRSGTLDWVTSLDATQSNVSRSTTDVWGEFSYIASPME